MNQPGEVLSGWVAKEERGAVSSERGHRFERSGSSHLAHSVWRDCDIPDMADGVGRRHQRAIPARRCQPRVIRFLISQSFDGAITRARSASDQRGGGGSPRAATRAAARL